MMRPQTKALIVVVFLGLGTSPLAGQLAARLYQEACDGGSMLECNLLGIMYETGNGVTQDLGRAVTLYDQACNGEMMESCNRLAVMYANGAGVIQDFGRAITLFQQACVGGDRQGCIQLDELYRLMTLALLEQLPLEDRILTIGVEVSGTLSAADPEVLDGLYTQAWALELSAGQEVTVDVTSSDLDSYLWVTGPGLDSGLDDDDSGGGCDARITFTAPEDGEYRAIVNTAVPGETGEFVLRASDSPPATASGPCRRDLAVGVNDPSTVPLYVSTDELPCEYEVIETVSGTRLVRAGELESMRDAALGEAGASVGADAVLLRPRVGGIRLSFDRPVSVRFSGDAIRFIPGTCRSTE